MPTLSRTRLAGGSSVEPAVDEWVITEGNSIRLSDTAERLGQGEDDVRLTDLARDVDAASHGEAHHATEVAHLRARHLVARVSSETRVIDVLARRRDSRRTQRWRGVLAVAIHAHAESLESRSSK